MTGFEPATVHSNAHMLSLRYTSYLPWEYEAMYSTQLAVKIDYVNHALV